jgi:hypothetical protein
VQAGSDLLEVFFKGVLAVLDRFDELVDTCFFCLGMLVRLLGLAALAIARLGFLRTCRLDLELSDSELLLDSDEGE